MFSWQFPDSMHAVTTNIWKDVLSSAAKALNTRLVGTRGHFHGFNPGMRNAMNFVFIDDDDEEEDLLKMGDQELLLTARFGMRKWWSHRRIPSRQCLWVWLWKSMKRCNDVSDILRCDNYNNTQHQDGCTVGIEEVFSFDLEKVAEAGNQHFTIGSYNFRIWPFEMW